MESLTFSYLEYASGEELIALLRRVAKLTKKAAPQGAALSSYQDAIATDLGFQNWSILHKNLVEKSWPKVADIRSRIMNHPVLGPEVNELAQRTINVEAAVQDMREWARANYSPLVNFAYLDKESPTGFAWPDVDMAEELSAEFFGKYPEDLITEVGYALDAEEGPWGREEYGEG